MSKRESQVQIQARELALQLLNVQETMKGVVQTLERLERVEEGVDRPGALKHQPAADRNHQDSLTNLQALNAKLGCLQGVLASYQNESYRNQCVGLLFQWHQKRQGQYSPVLTQAALDSVSACIGEYQMKAASVRLNEKELSRCAARLYEACSRYHDKADKVSADPQGYMNRDHATKVYADGRMQETDLKGLLEAIRQDIPTHTKTFSADKRINIETDPICSETTESEAVEETKSGNCESEQSNVEDSGSKPAGKQTSEHSTSSKRRDKTKTGNQTNSNKSQGGSKTQQVASKGNPKTVNTVAPENMGVRVHGDTTVADSQDSEASDQQGCSEQGSPLLPPSHPCNLLISLLKTITAKPKVVLNEEACKIVKQVKSRVQKNPPERVVCVTKLYSWYTESEAPIPRNALLVVTSGIVACFDQSDVTLHRDQLKSKLSMFYNEQTEEPLKDIIKLFFTELEDHQYSYHR